MKLRFRENPKTVGIGRTYENSSPSLNMKKNCKTEKNKEENNKQISSPICSDFCCRNRNQSQKLEMATHRPSPHASQKPRTLLDASHLQLSCKTHQYVDYLSSWHLRTVVGTREC